jgi:hypothetical protein
MLVHNDQPTTICFLNTHGIRHTVQLCQHDLIKAALVDGRNSMFVGTYITLCYTTLNYIKLHYLKLHYIQTCVNIFANMRTYTVIYIYASSANTSNKIVFRILEEPYVPRLHQL